jgi:hypothetical protein
MLGGMTRAWCLALLVGLTAGSATGAPRPRPPGKVVRVERARGTTVTPRICDVQADKNGNCFGAEPKVGDIITLLDETGTVGEVRISETAPFVLAGRSNKSCEGLWSVKTELIRGDLSNMVGRTMGVIDPGLHPRLGRMIPKEQLSAPSGRADETPAVGFDRDGDRVADIVLSQSTCDGSGSMCIEEWLRVEGRMVRVHQVNFQNCGL